MTADATAAAARLLLDDAGVSALADTHVYGTELPDSSTFNALMPRHAISLQPAGGSGPGDGSYLHLDSLRLDVNCYGSTTYQARLLALAVHEVLKHLKRRTVTYNDGSGDVSVLLHSFTPSGGFVALREPETRWPRVLRSYLCLYAETEVE